MSAQPPSMTRTVERLEGKIAQMEAGLRLIADQQTKTINWIQANGIVFDGPLGTDPSNWEHVAFSIYNDLCQVDCWAHEALGESLDGTPYEDEA